LEHMYLISP